MGNGSILNTTKKRDSQIFQIHCWDIHFIGIPKLASINSNTVEKVLTSLCNLPLGKMLAIIFHMRIDSKNGYTKETRIMENVSNWAKKKKNENSGASRSADANRFINERESLSVENPLKCWNTSKSSSNVKKDGKSCEMNSLIVCHGTLNETNQFNENEATETEQQKKTNKPVIVRISLWRVK